MGTFSDEDTSKELLNCLQASSLFSSLDEGQLLELSRGLEHLSLPPGAVLMRQGEPTDRLYILTSGCLHVMREDLDEEKQLVSTVNPGQSIGELDFITGEIRTTTVVASEACTLVSLSKDGLRTISARLPGLEDQIVASTHRSFYTAQLNQLLEESNYFGSLGETVLEDLIAEFTFETVKGGQVLLLKGDPSDSLYLVLSGRLGVYQNGESGEKIQLIELGRGQTVGEMGLITHEPRSANVYALRDTLLARLSRESFERLLVKYPKDVMEHFAGASIKRLTGQIQGTLVSQKAALSIAVLADRPDVPIRLFAERLAGALQILGPTILINSRVCDQRLHWKEIAQAAEGDPGNNRLVLWLSEQEAAHQFLIYESDPNPCQWTERCIRQADHILLLSMQEDAQTGLADLPDLAGTPASLILLYPDETVHPTGTRQILAQHQLKDHYKVRINRRADYKRLARMLTGNGIGLVLSGGGARALAQVGVMRALLEAGLEFDATAGASAGAMNAALYAMGLAPQESLRRQLAVRNRIDYTFPYHSLVSGKNWGVALNELVGGWQIEDLWIDYFCISANLTRSSMFMHRSGPLFDALRASTSIPGVLPPAFHQGEILVDGGLINNFPVDLMRADPRIGYVIGIEVASERNHTYPNSSGHHVSGWRSLLARFLPFMEKPQFPTIVEILAESMMISKSQSENSNRSLADLYLCPPTQGYGMMDFSKIEEIVEGGYQYGLQVAEEQQAVIPRLVQRPL